jgi:DNA-binding SARP family transcriptional activator
MIDLRFGLLGPLQVTDDAGRELPLPRGHQRVLLARLLVEANRPVSTDRLVLDLWGEQATASARGSLQALVSRLRALLEPDRDRSRTPRLIVSRPPGYVLVVPPGAIDADRFVALSGRGRALLAAGDAEQARQRLDEALGLWRGGILADLADEHFVAPVAARLEALRTDALEHRSAALLQVGDTTAAIAALEDLTAADAIRERPWELLARALHTAGRTVEALERLRQVRGRLRDELGLDPGAALQGLEAALLRGDLDATVRAAASATDERTVLVGRSQERAVLERALGCGTVGTTSWVTIVGDSGMGKTTLVEDLARDAERRDVAVLVGRCHEAELAPAFWPWSQVLRGLVPRVPGAEQVLPATSRGPASGSLVDAAEVATGHTSGQLFELFDAVRDVLTTAASVGPLLVVLEDLHWADVESLHLVDFLAVQLRDVALTLVLTVRRGEGPDQLQRTLVELARRPDHTRLNLRGLDTPATAELVSALRGTPIGARVAAQIRERTGGNPFFTVELARLDDAALVGDTVPDTVLEALVRRLQRLPETAGRLLELAAVQGTRFRFDALTASSGLSPDEVLQHLDAALVAELVLATDDPASFRFAHALVQEAVLRRLTPLQRRRAHLRVATAMQALVAEGATTFRAEVAHHLLAATPLGDAEETLRAARAAAEDAESRLAFHEAAGWWRGALQTLDAAPARGVDDHERLQLLLACGRALGHAGEQSASVEQLAAAVDVAATLDDVPAMATAAVAFDHSSGFWNWVDYGSRPVPLLARLDRVLASIGDDDPATRVRVLAVRSIGEYYGDQDRGRALLREADELARRSGDVELVLATLRADLRFLSHHHLDHQLEVSREMLELASAQGRAEPELMAWTYRISHLMMAGDLDGAEAAYRRAWSLSEALNLPIYQAQLGWSAALFPLARGDLGTAAALLVEARELHAGTGLYLFEPVDAWTRAVLLWEQDRLEHLPEPLRGYVPEADVALRARAGDRRRAEEALTRLCAAPHPAIFHALGTLALRARVVADLAVESLADVLIEQLAPYEDVLAVFGTVSCVGPVATELARLHALRGAPAQALAMLDRCIARAEKAGWVTWASRASRARDEVRHGHLAPP